MKYQLPKNAILSEKLKLIYSTFVISNVGMIFASVVLVYVLRNDVSDFRLTLWLIAVFIVSIFAHASRHFYLLDLKRKKINIDKYDKQLTLIVISFGLLWSAASLFLFPSDSLTSQYFLMLTIVGVVAGSIGFLSPSSKLVMIFMPLCLLPLALEVLIINPPNGILITSMIFAFLIISLYHGKNYNYRTTLHITLQEEAKIRQQILLKAKKDSDIANKSKSDFLANMSHEIRTPMNGVIGINNLMLQYPLSKDQKTRAIAIQNSADSMLTIINDILDFSKIEAGKLNIEYNRFNFKNLIQIVSSSVVNRIHEKKLDYNCDIDPLLDCWVLGDSTRIRQILGNLLDNALKFTQTGSIKLSATIVKNSQKQCHIKIEVIDTGIGVSIDRQEAVFNRFIQADNTTSKKFGGTGLGLSISKQLVKLMNGNIGYQSNEGTGSIFWVSLGLEKSDKPSKKEQSHLNKVNKIEGKVLIVDDNEVNQMVIEGMLDIFNIKSDLVDNGKSAIKAVNETHYDLILMDCHMPIMDGYQATEVIRKNERSSQRKRVPIVAVTASAMQGDKEKCLACGMDDYLTKPIEPQELQEKLTQWMSQQ